MKKIEKITKYVSNLFDLYSMDDYGFFRDYDEDADETIEVPLFRFGKVDKDTIEKISINFGITPEEILNTDDCAAMRYWNKYPFFKLYKQYLHLIEWNQKYKDPEPTAEELLLNAIFTDKKGISVRSRYDFPSIKERLVQQLKEYNAVMPGAYHEGAEITDLRISTQTMFSFSECPTMIQSFLDMTDRLQELFYKAIEGELPTDEINEIITIVPQAKAKMREFGMKLTNFSCEFVWSDEERAKEHTRIYVNKNRSELYGWGKYIKTLKKTCRPVSKGGIEIPIRLPFYFYNDGFERWDKRIAARAGGSNNG